MPTDSIFRQLNVDDTAGVDIEPVHANFHGATIYRESIARFLDTGATVARLFGSAHLFRVYTANVFFDITLATPAVSGTFTGALGYAVVDPAIPEAINQTADQQSFAISHVVTTPTLELNTISLGPLTLANLHADGLLRWRLNRDSSQVGDVADAIYVWDVLIRGDE